PVYVPVVSLRGSTKDSLSVSWSQPEEELRSYIDFYKLSLVNVETGALLDTVKYANQSAYLFENLDHGTMYEFTVSVRIWRHLIHCSLMKNVLKFYCFELEMWNIKWVNILLNL
ncbi:UNVERIFIED_CONTAM: hypothetical protein GTU68_057208, partial [Idotea baltica]|nr:hypothetical protein [Idotea baltica]